MCDLVNLENQVIDIANNIPNINFKVDQILDLLCDVPICSSLAALASQLDLLNLSANNALCCDFTSIFDAISESQAALSSQIDNINCNVDFTSVLDAISISQSILSSQIENISFSMCCNFDPILDAISQSEANILSALDVLNLSRLPDIYASAIAIVDFTSVLDAISISEANILSAIDNNNNALCCNSILDAISVSQAVILSALDTILTTTNTCAPTPIFRSDIPTTITQAGYYCLANEVLDYLGGVVPAITINVSDVTIDLNYRVLSNSTGTSIFVTGAQNNITIQNGTIVSGFSGFFAQNSTNIVIKNVTIQNAIANAAIDFESVSNALIKS
jgi:hypothetical protein